MSFTRKLTLFIAAFMLRSSLFLGFTLLAVVLVLTNRETIKNTLISTDVYDRFSQSAIEESKKKLGSDPNALPLDNSEIVAVIKASLDKTSLRAAAETIIDASYDWLEGKKPRLEFSVDVSKNREILALGISNTAIERLANLPPCVGVPSETNIFKITCNPVGVDLAEERLEIYNTILDEGFIFPDKQITEDALLKSADGKGISETYPNAPTYYTLLKVLPWILLGTALFSAAVLIRLSRTRRKGLKVIATSLLGTGIVLAITPILYRYILPAIGVSLPGSSRTSEESFAAITNNITSQLYSTFNGVLINIAIQVIAAGVMLLLITKLLKNSKSPYSNLEKKAGLAISIEETKASGGISEHSVPIQTSEKPMQKQRIPSKLEKKYRKM